MNIAITLKILLHFCVLLSVTFISLAYGNANQDAQFKLSSRIQVLYLDSSSDVISNRDQHDFMVRRARVKLKGNASEWVYLNLQSEFSEAPKSSGADAKIIDAYILLKPVDHAQLFIGQHMAPALRQNLSHIGALLTIDRPGIASKSLTWGTSAKTRFSTLTMNNTDAGLRGSVNVRDMGITLFGHISPSELLHYKYYFGVYEGAESAQSERVSSRFQINIGNAEPNYFNASNYLGTKTTLALGASIDRQEDVARDIESGDDVDDQLYSLDAFLELPAGPGALSGEIAYINMDLGAAGVLSYSDLSQTLSSTAARSAEGDGAYIQTGYTIRQWQFWAGWEQWKANDDTETGSFNTKRLGFTYYFDKYQHAKLSDFNIKLGFERTSAARPFETSYGSDDTISTVSMGFFLSI